MSSDATSLAGRAAVVTGASSGVGRAIALELAGRGADVLVHARARREAAKAVCDQIRQRGRASHLLLADLADPVQCDQLVEQAWQWRNDITVWVNNAGGDVLTGPAAEWSFDAKLDYLWKVDVRGTIRLARAAGERMKTGARENGDAVILNMGWDQAQHGMGGDAGEMFAAIKGAVMAFSRSLAQSLAPQVRVNCLAPGWIQTAWGSTAPVQWQVRAQGDSLLGRWGTPEDVAQVAGFLAAPAGQFVVGQVVAINGGFRHGGS